MEPTVQAVAAPVSGNQTNMPPFWWPKIRDAIYGQDRMSEISWAKWGMVQEKIIQDRQAAVNHRQVEQIDNLFLLCEELYAGIDDTNRGDYPLLRPTKERILSSTGDTQPTNEGKAAQTQSKLFLRIGARYVDSAKAKVGELAIPVDGKFFTLKPTPVPTTSDGQVIDEAEANEKMRAAEKQIHDWLEEGHFILELRKVIADAARLGVGVLKGPEPTLYEIRRPMQENGRWMMKGTQGLRPTSRWVNAWNFFPAPNCGEDIQHGDYCLERDYYSRRQLEALFNHPAYFNSSLKQVIEQGPSSSSATQDPMRTMSPTPYQPFEVWFYHGSIPYEDLRTVKPDAAAEWAASGRGNGLLDTVPVKMTLINDTIVACALNPLMGGDFPYDTLQWERRPGSWVGIGISEQLFAPSKLLQSANRAMIRNAGNSSGSQIVIDQSGIAPLDGNPTIYPDKLWVKTPESVTDDVEKAFQVYEIPSRVPDLMRIVEYALRFAEESTNIPLVSQGYGGKSNPDTYGGMQLLNNNATQLLREIGANMDKRMLEPHLRRYYTYYIESPDIPDDQKGDWHVKATGTQHLIERPFQDQLLLQIGQMLGNPAFRIDPSKWIDRLMKGHQIDPNEFKYTDEEYQQLTENQPPPPQVQVQQMRGEIEQMKMGAKQQKDQADAQLQMMGLQVTAERDAAHAQSMTNTHERGMAQLQMLYEKELLKYANEKGITLDKIKAELAETTMKLNVQREISRETNQARQASKPAVEPAGRAKKGQGYQH